MPRRGCCIPAGRGRRRAAASAIVWRRACNRTAAALRPGTRYEMTPADRIRPWMAALFGALLVVAASFAERGFAETGPRADSAPRIAVVSFGLFGDQGVFQREASGAARIVASRFGAAQTVVRFNN